MGKLSLGLGLGVGYVLGARAGRDRYEQIKQAAAGFMGRPEVQQAVEQVRAAAPAPLQGSIDKLAGGVSGGQGSGSRSSSGQGRSAQAGSAGSAQAGSAQAGSAGIPDTEALVAEAAVLEEVDVVVTPPTPASGAGGRHGTDAPVPDPLVPPGKSGNGTPGRP